MALCLMIPAKQVNGYQLFKIQWFVKMSTFILVLPNRPNKKCVTWLGAIRHKNSTPETESKLHLDLGTSLMADSLESTDLIASVNDPFILSIYRPRKKHTSTNLSSFLLCTIKKKKHTHTTLIWIQE